VTNAIDNFYSGTIILPMTLDAANATLSLEYEPDRLQINPYYKVDDNGFMTGTEVFADEGSTVILGPQAQFR